MKLALSKIRLDGGTQPRAELDEATVVRYAEDLTAGAKFPQVVVFYDGKVYWLADGFHRVAAALKLGWREIEADVRQGDRRAAVLFSVGANSGHGLPRTNADKRRAVQTLLHDSEWSKWSNVAISKACAVSDEMVRQFRAQLPTVGGSDVRRGLDGKLREVPTPKLDDQAWAPLIDHDLLDDRTQVRALAALPVPEQRQVARMIVGGVAPTVALAVTLLRGELPPAHERAAVAASSAPKSERRANDAYYTPDELALAIVRRLAKNGLKPKRVLEPSVGGGAFYRAIRVTWPNATITIVDIDPEALARIPSDGVVERVQADFTDPSAWSPDEPFDLVAGNPAYSFAQAHIERALQLLGRKGTAAFLLRLDFLATQGRSELNSGPGRYLAQIKGRPSYTGDGKTDRYEYGLFSWSPDDLGPSLLGEPLDWDRGPGNPDAEASA